MAMKEVRRFDRLGSRPVLMSVSLMFGYTGLILKFTAPAGSPERVNELIEMMSDSIDDGSEFVPPDMLEEFENSVCDLVLDMPKDMRFDNVIPVRRPRDRRRYLSWDHGSHEWVYKPFDLRLIQPEGDRVMLVIRTPEEDEAAA